MYCPNCGSEIQENQKFCSNCGTNLEDIINSKYENISESVENNDTKTEEQNFDNYYKNKSIPLNKTTKIISIIALCIIALSLTVFGIREYKQYQKDIEPLEKKFLLEYAGNVTLVAKYDSNKRKISIITTYNDVIPQDWYIDYFREYYIYAKPIMKFINDDDKTEITNIEYIQTVIEKNKNPYMMYSISDVDLKYFAKFKKILVNKNLKFAITSPTLLCKNKNEILKEKNVWLKWKKEVEAQKEAERKHEEEIRIDNEVKELAKKWAFKNVDGQKVPIDFNPRKCLFNIQGTCFGHPFFVHGMSYEECKSTKSITGVETCEKSQDLYATTALVCGGKNNMPTKEELYLLLFDMYTNKGIATSKRINRDYIEYFRKIFWNKTTFDSMYKEDARRDLIFTVLMQPKEGINAIEFGGHREVSVPRYGNINVYDDPYTFLGVSASIYRPYSLCVDRKVSNSEKNVKKILQKNIDKLEEQEKANNIKEKKTREERDIENALF